MLKRKGKLNTIYLSDTLQKQLQGICEYPLTSVVAPMAYGKTTAINWFLDKCAKTPGTKVLRISVYSDALPIFWQSIQIAFAHAGLDLLKGYDCPSDLAGAALILDDLYRELAGPDECYILWTTSTCCAAAPWPSFSAAPTARCSSRPPTRRTATSPLPPSSLTPRVPTPTPCAKRTRALPA